MNDIPIYSIVAYSGTGKTTLLEKLVKEMKQRGLRIAAIKHDAHEFNIDHEGKDSWRLTQAGADITAIISENKAALMENRPIEFETLLEKITEVDIILTEGYKHGKWPKIAVQRNATGKPIPIPAEDCIAIVTDTPKEKNTTDETPRLGLEDISELADLIIQHAAL